MGKIPVGATSNPLYARLIGAVDSVPELGGAGIVMIDFTGTRTEVRGGPRRLWVFVAPKGLMGGVEAQATPAPSPTKVETFWDRWGGSVLNCGSATATGVVIYLSGGTASFIVGAFAVNSAALCGMSVGKAFAADEWRKFEAAGGAEYSVWITVETLMSLADLTNGVKGAVGVLQAWKRAGKLAKLQKVIAGKKLTRKALLELIRSVDPSAEADLAAKGADYVSKGKLLKLGGVVISDAKFIRLGNQQARVIVDAIGNALTVGGAPETGRGTANVAGAAWDIFVVQYEVAGTPN